MKNKSTLNIKKYFYITLIFFLSILQIYHDIIIIVLIFLAFLVLAGTFKMETCKWEINHLDNKAIFRPVYLMEDSVNFTALCQIVITPSGPPVLIAATSSAMMTTGDNDPLSFCGVHPQADKTLEQDIFRTFGHKNLSPRSRSFIIYFFSIIFITMI